MTRPLRDELTTMFGPLALLLLGGVVVLLLVFGEESAAAYRVWQESTAYGHCFFIAPIAAYLAWERRDTIAAAPVRPLPWVALAALPLGLLWLATERVGLMEGQQLVAMTLLQTMFLAVLGWQRFRALAVPLAYLYFMVPFGAFVTPLLQSFTAVFIDIGLDLLGIAHFSNDMLIDIPEGRFFIAEACAGLRFLIASIAFGALYACLIYRSPFKRLLFLAASVIIPIVANGFRGLGIVVLGHLLGSAEAAAVDHVVYGWVFFSLVILMLVGAGLPFREDTATQEPPAPPAPTTGWRRPLPALAASLTLISLLPVLAGVATRAGVPQLTEARSAALVGGFAGCQPDGGGGQHKDDALIWRYACPVSVGPVERLTLQVTLLSTHASPGAILRLRRAVTHEQAAENTDIHVVVDNALARWVLVDTSEPDRVAAYAAWIDDKPAGATGWQGRLQVALASLHSDRPAPAMVTLSLPEGVEKLSPAQRRQLQAAILGIVSHNQALPRLVRQLADGG